MFKRYFIVLTFAQLTLGVVGCSGVGEKLNESSIQQPVIESSVIATPTVYEIRKDPVIIRRAIEYGLDALDKEHSGENEYELRIWSSVDLTYFEKCLAIKRTDNKMQAWLIEPVVSNGELHFIDSDRVVVRSVQIEMSGEAVGKIESIIASYRLTAPLPYDLDTDLGNPVVDEGVIAIEVKEGRQYDVIAFGTFSSSSDGRRIIQACEQIERSLGIRIGCIQGDPEY